MGDAERRDSPRREDRGRERDDLPENSRLFIGNVNGDRVQREDIRDLFRKYGTVIDVHVNQTFAFVEFENVEQAREARERLNGRELMGKSMRIDFSKSRSAREVGGRGGGGGGRGDAFRILIEGIPRGSKWSEVKDWCKANGMESNYTNVADDVGEAAYATEQEMKDAIAKLDGLEWDGKKVHVREGRLGFRPFDDRGPPLSRRDREYSPRRDDRRGGGGGGGGVGGGVGGGDDRRADKYDRHDDRRRYDSPRRDDRDRDRDRRDRRSPPRRDSPRRERY